MKIMETKKLHVDVDPPVGDSRLSEQAEIPQPALIVETRGGRSLLWKIDDPQG